MAIISIGCGCDMIELVSLNESITMVLDEQISMLIYICEMA